MADDGLNDVQSTATTSNTSKTFLKWQLAHQIQIGIFLYAWFKKKKKFCFQNVTGDYKMKLLSAFQENKQSAQIRS